MLSGLALALTLSFGPSEQDLIVARALHEKGSEYLQSGDYEKAATLFSELYERTGDPWALYNHAQAERLSGDCKAAVPLYRVFLGAEGLDDRDRFHASRNIERCGGDPTPLPAAAGPKHALEEPDASPKSEINESREESNRDDLDALPAPRLDESAPPPPPSPFDEDRMSRRNVAADPIGWSLVGAGVLGISVGIPFQVLGSRDADETPGDEETEAEYVDRVEDGRRQRAVGTALIATGSVLAVAGVVRFVLLATKSKRTTNLAALTRF